MNGSRIYGIWLSMRNRCHNPNVAAYKGLRNLRSQLVFKGEGAAP